MKAVLNSPGTSRIIDPSSFRCSRTPAPPTPMASSSAILASRSATEKPIWLTPVPWLPPAVGWGMKTSSTPSQLAASPRSASGSQPRCSEYHSTPLAGLDVVTYT